MSSTYLPVVEFPLQFITYSDYKVYKPVVPILFGRSLSSFLRLLRKKAIIGVVHLLPLPGSPLYGGSMKEVLKRAINDAEKLEEGGVDAIIVENFGDVPYYPRNVPPITVSSMTYIASKIVERVDIPVGVNVLRNDAIASLSIAHVVGAEFIRVNILTEAIVTDQGIIEGAAHELLRMRRYLSSDIVILADVHVKHGYPLMKRDIGESALDLIERGLADALVITGRRTGEPPSKEKLISVKKAVPKTPVLIGSGITLENISEYFDLCDSFIIGTYFKVNGIVKAPVDLTRVKELVNKVSEIS